MLSFFRSAPVVPLHCLFAKVTVLSGRVVLRCSQQTGLEPSACTLLDPVFYMGLSCHAKLPYSTFFCTWHVAFMHTYTIVPLAATYACWNCFPSHTATSAGVSCNHRVITPVLH